MITPRSAFVFSTDEAFAPLAKGLVLSMQNSNREDEFALHMIDIGCSESTIAWMRDHSVVVARFDRARFLRQPKALLKPYQEAQLCRPFIPQMFPGFDVYIWSDADIWVQDIDSIRLYRDIALHYQDKVPIAPLVDASYSYFYEDASEFITYSKRWYDDAYGPTVADTYANRVILGSGLFAMHCQNSLWSAWASELNHIFQRNFSAHVHLHLAEQTALNYLLYAKRSFIPVEAIHNYNCHVGRLARHTDGDVRLTDPPYRRIGVIHFTHSSKMMGHYIDAGLLFDAGKYLTPAELAGLRSLSHY